MAGPRYSFVVANLNSSNTVERWWASILPQLTPDDELVIVDGMSTDGSRAFLQRASKEHGFTFICRKTNIGQARQLGYLASAGKYVVSNLDTDDLAVDLKGAKRLYHEVVEYDPVVSNQRAFWCGGFFIIPRRLLDGVGGYPPLNSYEDRCVAYKLAIRNALTATNKVSAVARGYDPKKRRLSLRAQISFRRIRDGLRLGFFEDRTPQGWLILPPAWLASSFMTRYEYRPGYEAMDVNRDSFILPWIEANGLRHLLRSVQQAPIVHPPSPDG